MSAIISSPHSTFARRDRDLGPGRAGRAREAARAEPGWR